MHACFGGKQTARVFAFEADGGGLDAGFLAGSFIENGRAIALSFGPPEIHAQEHGGPVLRFGAARAGLDGHDSVQVIGFAGEQRLGLQLSNILFGGIELAGQLAQQLFSLLDIRLLAGEVDVGFEVARDARELLVGRDLILGLLALAEDPLRSLLVLPEVGTGDFLF